MREAVREAVRGAVRGAVARVMLGKLGVGVQSVLVAVMGEPGPNTCSSWRAKTGWEPNIRCCTSVYS